MNCDAPGSFFISLVGDPYKPSLATLTGWGSVPQTPPNAICSRTLWVKLLLSNDPKSRIDMKNETRRFFDQHVQNALNQRAKSHLKTYR